MTIMRRATTMRGFTLIELMITVAIIGILAAIAYPAYTHSVLKGRRAEGRAALTDLLQQQERYLTQTGSYMIFAAGASGSNGTTTAGSGQSIPFRTYSGDNSGSAAYKLKAESCAVGMALNECVKVSAEPVASDAEAGTLWVSSAGARGCTGTNSSVCWK